jgi:hypothetical protein
VKPLNLPRGTVRAFLVLVLLAVSIVCLFVQTNDEARGMFLMLTGIAVRDYFATRATQDAVEGPPLPEPYVDAR